MQPTADPPTPVLTGGDLDISPGMSLPLPDEVAAAAARDRLASIDIGISAPTVTALGMLAEAVVFVAGVQGSAHPRPLLSTRVVLVTGAHAGGVVAGPAPDPRNSTPLQHLAANAGAGVVTLEWQPASAAIELEDAITTEQMDAALRAGWAEADRAADEGIELLVLAAGGAGASTAAAAVVAAATGSEPTALLARVVTPAGIYDDNAWMTRCLALRDALHRVRDRHGDPRTVLAALGGADIAAATGLILGAASRRTPVMIDGPVGAAAALLANDFAPHSRRWVLLPDTGRQMAVRLAAEALELRPWLDLCLDLGEGAASLAALPMLQTALTLAGAGEPVEATAMSRYDSTGNQVFVGVARPVEPAVPDEPSAEAAAPPDQAVAGKKADTGKKADAEPRKDEPATAGVGTAPKGTGTKPAAAKTAPKAAPAKAGPAKTAPSIPAKPAAKETPEKETPTPEPAAKEASVKEAPAKEFAAKDPLVKETPAKVTTQDTEARTTDASTKAGPATETAAKGASAAAISVKPAGKEAPPAAVPARPPTSGKDATPATEKEATPAKPTPPATAKDTAPAKPTPPATAKDTAPAKPTPPATAKDTAPAKPTPPPAKTTSPAKETTDAPTPTADAPSQGSDGSVNGARPGPAEQAGAVAAPPQTSPPRPRKRT